MARILNLVGDRYGRLVVKSFAGSRGEGGNKKRFWLCSCDCGGSAEVSTTNLRKGNSKSCGCTRLEKTRTHGMHKTRIYQIWADMKDRCNNKNNLSYGNYGGRGITYCDEWERFEAFLNDMVKGYSEGLTLERKNVNGNYCPENCSWVSMREQAQNRRINSRNISGVTGVRQWTDGKNGNKYFVSSWVDYPIRKNRQKFFGVNKYGEELAFFLACEYRELMISRLNLLGAGYTENHGK